MTENVALPARFRRLLPEDGGKNTAISLARHVPWLGMAVAGTFSVLVPAARAQAAKFDGRWSAEVITKEGVCNRAYRYAIVIDNGRARCDGQDAFDVSGKVQPSEAVAGSIFRGQDRARVSGRLAADGMGAGTWSTSGSRTCAGRWNAERRS